MPVNKSFAKTFYEGFVNRTGKQSFHSYILRIFCEGSVNKNVNRGLSIFLAGKLDFYSSGGVKWGLVLRFRSGWVGSGCGTPLPPLERMGNDWVQVYVLFTGAQAEAEPRGGGACPEEIGGSFRLVRRGGRVGDPLLRMPYPSPFTCYFPRHSVLIHTVYLHGNWIA